MKIDLVLLSLRSKKGTPTLELLSHCLGRAFRSPAHAGESVCRRGRYACIAVVEGDPERSRLCH